jgi:hypothetical protein
MKYIMQAHNLGFVHAAEFFSTCLSTDTKKDWCELEKEAGGYAIDAAKHAFPVQVYQKHGRYLDAVVESEARVVFSHLVKQSNCQRFFKEFVNDLQERE